MQIDHQAAFVNHREILIKSTPDRIWKLQADIEKWSQWQTHVGRSSIDGPLRVGTVFHWRARGLNITSTLRVVQPNKFIGWTGTSWGTQACHTFTFKTRKNGTLVIAEESLNGWLPRLMKLIMPNYLKESMDSSLQNLKNKAEGKKSRGKS